MPQKLRRIAPDLLIAAFLLIVPLLFFFSQTLGGKTVVPLDNLFQWEPYRSLAGEYGVGAPHNGLLSDLILENTAWKQFLREQVTSGQVPFWQPYILGGSPFLAAGQSQTLYPFSVLFLVMPITAAFGWFIVSQLWLAGLNMYILARVLGVKRIGGVVAALAYQLSGFMMVSGVFPMILAASAWLPLELATIDLVLRQGKAFGGRPATIPWVALGAVGLGMAALAGHVEALYFTLLVMAFFALARVIAIVVSRWGEPGLWASLAIRLGWLLALVVLGLALGAAQILPAYELASRSFREGAASLAQVRGWAYPARRIIAFLMPNFFGSPAHHSYLDVFTWQWVPVTTNAYGDSISHTHWGIKNYVEGGAYLGILPMALAALAALHWIVARLPTRWAKRIAPLRHVCAEEADRPYRAIFGVLGLASISFVFGTPTYALLYYGLPFINQSHSPFRWVWPLTLSVALLAGYGVELLRPPTWQLGGARDVPLTERLAGVFGWGGIVGGIAILGGLVAVRGLYDRVGAFVQRVFMGLALAPGAFPDGQAFFSYEAGNAALFALMLLITGLIFLAAKRGWHLGKRLGYRPVWRPIAIVFIIFDLGVAITGFYPAADPALLDVEPPSITWLKERVDEANPWRLIAFEEPGADTLNANLGWLHGLEDASGYDSLIPGQYAAYMGAIEPQGDLLYNRIAPIYSDHAQALDSPLLDLLTVRYVVSETPIDNPRYSLAYQDDAVSIYENLGVMPRAFTLPLSSTARYSGDFAQAAAEHDVRGVVLADEANIPAEIESQATGQPGTPSPASITVYTPNELWIDVETEVESWLVIADSYYPGWRAWTRPFEGGDNQEQETKVWLVDGNFRGVVLPPGTWTVRLKYTPDTFRVGAFISFMAGMTIVFGAAVWLWRYAYTESPHDSDLRRVAKNSLAPILLNLFNRGIQFAFAFVSLRILGPEGSGKYQYAVVIWGWFEILSNFGLNTLLTREVARNREDANRYLVNTSIMRLALAAVGAPLLIGFIAIRQLAVHPPLGQDSIWTIGLLYGGLFLSTISTGLTALFYAYEKAEYPAAIQTVSAFLVSTLGVAALLMGYGIVGLAGVSIVVNAVTLAILLTLTIRQFFRPHWAFDWGLQRAALGESFPLMINHLLATLFFRVDIILLEAMTSDTVVGWYGVVYKWIDAINVIPAFFTQALFPVMSRQGETDRPALLRNYILSVKLLTIISMPLAVVTTLLAFVLIGILGGSEFLPHGAIALQIFVWSIPIGWINSVTNYVIIAVNRQRMLTWAFVIGVVFNVAANLAFIPRYSYRAAAAITILSEMVLLTFFYLVMRPALGRVPWARILWRILAATALMAGATWALAATSLIVALVGGTVVYVAATLLLRPFSREELSQIAPLLPEPLRARFKQPDQAEGQAV
jgi:O-antigen/teichoic acid export membrane protein